MTFDGFDPETLRFYAGLEADNSRGYWLDHRAFYDRAVRGAMEELAEALGDRFRPVHIFRPNRDVRFSRDKSPYKTHCGALHEREGGAMDYVQLSASGLLVATGFYQLARDQLLRMREALADDEHGPRFVAAAKAVTDMGLELGPGAETALKRAPRGIAADHPRVAWLRWKGAIASRDFGAPRWLHTAACAEQIVAVWDAAEPLNAWMQTHVGPSRQPPEGAEAALDGTGGSGRRSTGRRPARA